MQDFRHLKVWQLAHEVALEVYKITRHFPKAELYALVSQVRRAAVSTAANIAEGASRSTDPSMRAFLDIAIGSAGEVEYFLLLATDLEYLTESERDRITARVQQLRRMLNALMQRIGTRNKSRNRSNATANSQ
jgi:four helix bundle protein